MPRTAAALTTEAIIDVWSQVGAYERMGAPVTLRVGRHTAVDVPLRCAAGEVTGRMAFNDDGTVAGLLLLPLREYANVMISINDTRPPSHLIHSPRVAEALSLQDGGIGLDRTEYPIVWRTVSNWQQCEKPDERQPFGPST